MQDAPEVKVLTLDNYYPEIVRHAPEVNVLILDRYTYITLDVVRYAPEVEVLQAEKDLVRVPQNHLQVYQDQGHI